MKIILLGIVLSFVILSGVNGQAPGIVVQAGLSTAYAKDANITNANQAHYGTVIGADARLLDGNMYFIIGGHYHSTSLASSSNPDFFKNNDWKVLMMRMGLGFNVVKFSEHIALRSKLLGSINFILDAPSKALQKPGYEEINDSYLGVGTGVGLTVGIFDIDLDYQYGVINAYKDQPKSTFDVWSLMFGVHF